MELGEKKTIYHPGPVTIYLGKAPSKAADWEGTGKRWFKVLLPVNSFRYYILMYNIIDR